MNLSESILATGVCIVLPIAGMTTAYVFRRLSSRERLAAIEKGVSVPMQTTSPMQRAARVRRNGIVLLALGIGLAFSLIVAWLVEGDKGALIGAGLLIDYRLLRKEMAAEQ